MVAIQHRQHARKGLGQGRIDRLDPGVGIRAAQYGHMNRSRWIGKVIDICSLPSYLILNVYSWLHINILSEVTIRTYSGKLQWNALLLSYLDRQSFPQSKKTCQRIATPLR
jgi:hypothetical protein